LKTSHKKWPQELQHAKQQMDQAFAILQNMRKKDSDECDLFGKIIAKQLKKILESKREELMYEIYGIFLTCFLSPVEVYIQRPPPTSVSSGQRLMLKSEGLKTLKVFLLLI
jgi:hypothetical protein